jgi:hypothetical protein
VKFSFRVPGEHGTQGTYQFWSFERSRWRTEISARGYHHTEVGFPDHRAVAADLPYVPQPIQTLLELVSNGTEYQWPLNGAKLSVKNEQDGTCAVIKREKKNELQLCFDRATSLLHTVTDRSGNRFEFLDYQSIDGRMVPRKLNAYEAKYLVVEAKLETLQTLATVDAALTQPPPNAENWDWCENMQPPKLIRAIRPMMPFGAWRGFSRFWVVVGTDGRVEQGGLMDSGGPALDRAAAAAMEDWLFRPAMCQGIPVRVKTTASFAFQ